MAPFRFSSLFFHNPVNSPPCVPRIWFGQITCLTCHSSFDPKFFINLGGTDENAYLQIAGISLVNLVSVQACQHAQHLRNSQEGIVERLWWPCTFTSLIPCGEKCMPSSTVYTANGRCPDYSNSNVHQDVDVNHI